jgi:hypothetical protein
MFFTLLMEGVIFILHSSFFILHFFIFRYTW